MCTYTVKKQKLKKSSRRVRDSSERPKLGVSGVKDTSKTNRSLGVMLHTGKI